MKKFILTFMVLLLAFCLPAFSKTIIDSSGVNGVIRATVSDHSELLKQTNAYKNDFVLVGKPISNWQAGFYQAKKNLPKSYTNWLFVFKVVSTNYVGQVGTTNTAFAVRTNVLHPVILTEVKAYTNVLNGVVTKISTNLSLTRSLRLTSTNTYHNGTRIEATNLALTRSLRLIQTNDFHNGIKNSYTNVISTFHTNRAIYLYSVDTAFRYRLYITNNTIKAITNR